MYYNLLTAKIKGKDKRGKRLMADTDKKLKKLEDEIKAGQKTDEYHSCRLKVNSKGSSDHELLQFFMGFLLFGGGIFWILNSFTVSSTWGGGYWSMFGMRLPTGTMLIPLLVGIGLLFFLDRKIIGGIVCCLGLLVILISLLTSLEFHAVRSSLYVYILMFSMTAAGAALLIKTLFRKR